MRFTLLDVFMPLFVAVGFAVIGWASVRPIYAGRPLPTHMKKAVFYGFFFVLGMGYLMMFGGGFNWPHPLLFAAIGAWGVLLASIAWWRYRQRQAVPEIPRRPVAAVLAEGLPALGLLISVIAGAVEWEYIFEGQGRWWVGVLWLAGVAASILAARHNRRATLILVLRGVVALLIIGAVAKRTPPALIAAAVSGLALLLLEKFWHSNPNDGDQAVGKSAERS